MRETIKWLKRIFSATTVTIIVSTASLLIAVLTYINSTSGELSITVNREVLPLPKNPYNTTQIYELCLINQTPIHIGAFSKCPRLENLSSRAINNLNYEVMVIPRDDIDLKIEDEFDLKKNGLFYNTKYKYDNLKAHQSTKGVVGEISFDERQARIEFVYSISFDGAKEPIIFPYTLFVFNVKNEELAVENYLSLRNSFLQVCYDNLQHSQEDNVIITVADTTVRVKDIKYLNTKEYKIQSITDLEKDLDNESLFSSNIWVWLSVVIMLIVAVYFAFQSELEKIVEFYRKKNRMPTSKEIGSICKNSENYLELFMWLLLFASSVAVGVYGILIALHV